MIAPVTGEVRRLAALYLLRRRSGRLGISKSRDAARSTLVHWRGANKLPTSTFVLPSGGENTNVSCEKTGFSFHLNSLV